MFAITLKKPAAKLAVLLSCMMILTLFCAAMASPVWAEGEEPPIEENAAVVNCDDIFLPYIQGPTPKYTVSGTILLSPGNTSLTDVTVKSSDGQTVTTNGSGFFTMSSYAGTYTITPTKAGYVFNPGSASVTVPPAANVNFIGTVVPTFTWSTNTLDISATVAEAGDHFLRIDSSNRPWLVYGSDHLYLVRKDSSGNWNTTTIDSTSKVGSHASLVVANTSKAYVSYYNENGLDLKYATWDGTKWTPYTVDSSGDVGKYTAVAMDSNNNPRIAYYDTTNKRLKYAAYNGSTWTVSIVESNDVGKWASLAMYGDNPSIAYYDAANQKLKYANLSGSTWKSEIVDNGTANGPFATLAMNGSKPRIAYFNDDYDDLKFADNDSGNWTLRTLDSTGLVGLYASLAVDGNGKPYIAYFDSTTRLIKMAYSDGTNWFTTTVSTVPSANNVIAVDIAVDQNNKVVIAYYDSTAKTMKVIFQN